MTERGVKVTRKYYPAEGGKVGTVFGEIGSGGLSCDELSPDEIAVLEDMANAGVLRAEGELPNIDIYLNPWHPHAQRHRHVTRAVADFEPFHPEGKRKRSTKKVLSAQQLAQLSASTSVGPGTMTSTASPRAQEKAK